MEVVRVQDVERPLRDSEHEADCTELGMSEKQAKELFGDKGFVYIPSTSKKDILLSCYNVT